MRLKELVQPLLFHTIKGDSNQEITSIETDSRKVKPGALFIALKGYQVNGHHFVQQAVERGAVALLVEEQVQVPSFVTRVQVPDTHRASAYVAAVFYQHPTQELRLIGVTGTNGKTTTTHLIKEIFLHAQLETGLIGTTGIQIQGEQYSIANTTPDAVMLQKTFRHMLEKGCHYSVIEVSSHALDLGRLWGSTFQTGIFTNLTQDHLDYHETMGKYREAKALLFQQLGGRYQSDRGANAVAILNGDDPASSYFAQTTPAQVITYGIKESTDVRASQLRSTANGTEFILHSPWGKCTMQLNMVGTFNVYNCIAAITVALTEGVSLQQIQNSLPKIGSVEGRMELVQAGQPFTVLVDYAHTPDSLRNVLDTVREFAQGRVITVFGCGGDRDRTKRPEMGEIAAIRSDITIVTSDNPRSEDPEQILRDIIAGITRFNGEYIAICDRKEAIQYAIAQALPEDVILIAGKGHETYQEIDGVKTDFDDRKIAYEAIVEVQK